MSREGKIRWALSLRQFKTRHPVKFKRDSCTVKLAAGNGFTICNIPLVTDSLNYNSLTFNYTRNLV